MKKTLLILYVLLSGALLSSCRGELFSGHRDMEHLRPVQTLGFDAEGDTYTMSISTGAGPDDTPPLVMKATAPGIESAAAHLQDWSPEDELFYAHIRFILLGQSMADGRSEGIETVLDWVERSPSMRMDTPLILIRGRADEAVIGALGDATDVTERLASLERFYRAQGGSLSTLRQTACSLLERGWALCLAAALYPDEGTNFTKTENSLAIVPAGLALLRPTEEGIRANWLTRNESMGTELLRGNVTGTPIPLEEGTLELIRGSAVASGIWAEDGTPMGLYIRCELLAGILEREGGATEEALTAELSEAAEGWLRDTAERSAALGCDFAGLADAMRKNAPGRGRNSRITDDVLFSLPVIVSVDARIASSYDLSE